MRINWTLDALGKLSYEELEKIYNEKTTPTLEMVLKKTGKKKPKSKPKKKEK